MLALSLGALVAAVLLNLALAAYANQAIAATYAGIVGTVVERYPEAEAQVVQDLRAPAAPAVARGIEVLRKYGLGEGRSVDGGPDGVPNGGLDWGPQTSMAGGMLARLLLVDLLLVGLVCTGFALLLLRYRRSVAAEVGGLAAYLRRIDAGDYSLDVRDNGEGGFSRLKNDLYKVTVRLREGAEQLQKDKTALANLIADISHQIKTPLTSLGVLVDLLAEDPPEADRAAFVERLRAELGRIQWLTAALLKLARLDGGTAAFKSEPVDIRRLVDRALAPLQIPLEIKGQQLVLEGPAGPEGAGYTGDLNWSAEALTNVVKNCVEHTPEGGTIAIRYGANPLYAEIVVADNGPGIGARDLPHIFNRFYRGQNAGENSVGIGLALAKAIFNAQGGDITVRSEPGEGTTFEIRVFHGVV